jgi:hypothetical protein
MVLSGMGFPVLALLSFVRGLQGFSDGGWFLLGAILSFVLLAGSIGGWIWLRSVNRRDQDIRLVLGTHAWGSSDPCYWHDSLFSWVKPAATLGAPTFADLARGWLAASQWSWAMWAARLSAALEDETYGEQMTDTILATAAVEERLRLVRKEPHSREAYFGSPPPLSAWIQGDLQTPLFTIGAQ